jgi:drug/metabolite transporter (DMT)-like permease
MSVLTTAQAQAVLFGGYVLFSVALNGIALLISLFYRKKFRHPSPRWGFLAAIVFSLLYCVLLAGGIYRSPLVHSAAQVFLACSALASVMSTVNLFLIMQKVRK